MRNTLVEILKEAMQKYPDRMAFRFRSGKGFQELTYRDFEKKLNAFSTGLVSIGIKFGEHVGLIADVSHEWSLSNFAIQMIGAVDVPRGTDSTADEIAFILKHSGSQTVLVISADEALKIEGGLKKAKYKVKRYIILDNNIPKGKKVPKAITLDEVIKKGQQIIDKKGKELKEIEKRQEKIKPDNTAAIIYTSGTTGDPKGVMLSQGNFASQLNIVPDIVGLKPGEKALSLLPPWHIFGRTGEYLFFSKGMSLMYTDIKNIGEDMKTFKPTFVPAVPRIWEGVYNKIIAGIKKGGKEGIFNVFRGIGVAYFKNKKRLVNQEKLAKKRNIVSDIALKTIAGILLIILAPLRALGDILVFKKIRAATGGKLKGSISGGGALPGYIDDFFGAIGINILEGYGLTETSPVLAVREKNKVVIGTIGAAIPHTQTKLIDADDKDVTKIPGAKGTLWVKGPQVMQGYYKNPKKTNELLKNGWFNTGDLVTITHDGLLSIVGRTKDTIVLIGGENIEPTPIEEKLKESAYIDQVMVVGQDKKTIGALIVPNADELASFAKTNKLTGTGIKDWISDSQVNSLLKAEIKKLINPHNGFKHFEQISSFRLIAKPFEKGVELTNKLSVKRHVVADIYANLIADMYK
ncbi:MAG: AMP-binding protein [Spirochaetia bacterium]|nr:AMP-binding protein [Spirochaetia bacterium]